MVESRDVERQGRGRDADGRVGRVEKGGCDELDEGGGVGGVGEEFGGGERGGEEVAGEVDGYDAELVGAGCVELGDFGDDGEDGLLRVFCEVAAYAGVDEGEAEEVDEGEEG